MNVLVELEHCYGIQKLTKEFDFSKGNVYSIYARNGLMKTSFSKTFKKIQDGKVDEIKDEIFDNEGILNVKIDGQDVKKENVFVIKSFENSYESDSITSLLINDDLRNSINSVLLLKDKFLKSLEKYSGLKVSKTSAGKKVYELEPTIVCDFGFEEESFLLNLDKFIVHDLEVDLPNVKYGSIFDESVISKIITDSFQQKIQEYIARSDEIYRGFDFLQKGNFTLPKLKDTEKTLAKNNFFVKGNMVKLGGNIDIVSNKALKDKIAQIEGQLRDTPELKEIEKMLSDAKGTVLRDIIESIPDIVPMLAIDKLNDLKKVLWLSYMKAEIEKFEELKTKYHMLEEGIAGADFDQTPWKVALDIFEKRFTVPYKMEISNLKSSIIGESVPRVEFIFFKDGNRNNESPENCVRLNRSELDSKDTLSQGEKRALYLLNIIFDIEKIRREQNEMLLIVDDIADSFDYKNKYAIVEYLCDMAKNDKFYIIILSHNFDFYRTVSGRLNLERDNRLCAQNGINEIALGQEKYQKQPFDYWKKHLNKKNVIALIPFVRNIVEYGVDKNIGQIGNIANDFLLLTHLLHVKTKSRLITFDVLKKVYKEYIGKDNFDASINNTDIVCDAIYQVADNINTNEVDLENKIILAIAIRHISETFMFNEVNSYTGILNWKDGRQHVTGTSQDFMTYLETASNQTRELFNSYIQFGTLSKIAILEQVNIMTPENIHLNSFMYEPILDMDIVELINLYNEIKAL